MDEKLSTDMQCQYDFAVVGGGLTGDAAAIALANLGYRIAHIAPSTRFTDGRTTALMMPSIHFLEELDVFWRVSDMAAPLRVMRIIDATRRLLRAPTVTFRAAEIDLDAFGYNIPNAVLSEAMSTVLDGMDSLSRIDSSAETIEMRADGVTLHLANGTTIGARHVIGADGRNSSVRAAAGIRTRNWSYPQTALVLTFRHEREHGNISNEFHTEHGPFTQVPLPANRSSLVWVTSEREAARLMMLPRPDLDRAIEERMGSMLGPVETDSEVQSFAMAGMIAQDFGKQCASLVGEAAHVFPPIGAQGLNLGLRDVSAFVDFAKRHGPDDPQLAQRYARSRRGDVVTRTWGVDALNRSLLSSLLPVQMTRVAGLGILSAVSPLRTIAMREGVQPGSSLGHFMGSMREQVRR